MKFMKYGVDVYSFQTKKWGKVLLKVISDGTLQMCLTPTYTPGVEPEELKGQTHVPKGYNLYEYSKEVIVNMAFADIKNLVDWNMRENKDEVVDIYRKKVGYNNKQISFRWYAPDGDKISTATIFITDRKRNNDYNEEDEDSEEWNVNSFKIPMSLDEMNKLCKIFYFYMSSIPTIEVLANSKMVFDDDDRIFIEEIVENTVKDVVSKESY